MTFHEEYEMYRKAGIDLAEEMLDLSEAGVSGRDAEESNKAGIDSIEGMLDLSRAGISGMDAEKYASWGFAGDVTAMKTLKEKFQGYLHDPCSPSYLQMYVEAGFAGDLDAILELSEQMKHGGSRIDPDYAIFLAEHGLKGDKEAMLNIPMAIGHDTLKMVACRIAYRLAGEETSFIGFRHSGIQNSTNWYEDGEDIRKRFADQIPASSLVLLVQYDLGEKEAAECHPLERELDGMYAKRYALEKSGDQEAVQMVESEIKEVREGKFEERLNGTAKLRDDKLMEAYNVLIEQGEDAFKAKYTLNEGWVDDRRGGLHYDGRVASQLQQERWQNHERELRGLD